MPDRFGQGGDYSQTFAYLYDQNLNKLEADAKEADQQREEDQAAKDQQIFDRYNAGKISDDDLLAYIRRRIAETGYDKTQQANWKQALLQYSETINDAKALREFERTKDYAGYLSYLRAKAAGMKGNAAKKAEIEQQIQSLVTQRDQNSVARGADRILLNIQRGKATYDDLLAFYKERLGGVSDPALKQQIRGQITDLTARIRSDNLQNRVSGLGRQLANRDITPQQYGRQLQELANQSGFKETNPAQYNAWMDDATKAINTVMDTGRLQEIEGKLMRGEISPQQAMVMYYAEADRYKIADPVQYQTIRNLGWEVGHKPADPIPGQTPLPNGNLLGLTDNSTTGGVTQVGGVPRKQFSYITQLDGSEFGQVNCVYAASAMLAYAMGYREKGGGAIAGGDLRYLSGDRGVGTNLDEAEAALAQLGIGGLRNWNDKHISFEAFKKRLGQKGMPAVLMGVNNNLPDSLKAFQGAARGHGVFVAAYDPKKDAFLWYDPAVSKNQNPKYNGVWVDADVVQNFGWGPAYSDSTGSWSFSGQALFAPPGTVKGGLSATDVKRPDIHYVNVDDAPVRPETPKRYRGYNHRGPSTVEPHGNPVVDSKGKPRAAANGRWFSDDGNRIDTVEEVAAELQKDQKRLELLNQLDDAFGKGKDKVTIGGQDYLLTPALFSTLDRERLHIYDKGILFSEAAGLGDIQDQFMKEKNGFLVSAATRNSIDASVIINNTVRNSLRIWNNASNDPDPNKAIDAARAINGTLKVLTGVLKAKADSGTAKDINGNEIDDPLNDLSNDPKQAGSVPNLDLINSLFDIVANPSDVPLADRVGDINSILDAIGSEGEDDPLHKLTMGIAEQFEGKRQIDSGEGIPYIDGQDGTHHIAPVAVKTDIATGTQFAVPVKSDANGQDYIQVPVQTQTGVEMQWVKPGQQQFGSRLVATTGNKDLGLVKGTALDETMLQKIIDKGGEPYIQSLIAGGLLREEPIMFTTVQLPGGRKDGRTESGPMFVQDPGSKNWYQGVIPATDIGLHVGKWFAVGTDLMPDFNWQPYATAGMVPSPYKGDRKAIQEAADRGEVVLPKTFARGYDGAIDPNETAAGSSFYHQYDPLSSAYQTAQPKDEDPTQRAERIRENVENVLRNVRDLEYQNRYTQGYLPTADDLINDPKPGGPQGPQTMPLDPTVPAPRGEPGYAPPQPLLPTSGFGPMGEGPSGNAPLPDTRGLADTLGLNLGNKPGPQGPQGGKPLPGPKGPQYQPPAPKVVRGPGGKKESVLPRVGGSVTVGGTRIDLPSTSSTKPPKHNTYKPPAPMGTGGAAAASVAMLTRNTPTTRRTASGRSQD